VVDIADPANPREIGHWGGSGRGRLFVWGVVPHNDLILASDMGYGLYILRHEP
ncbi:MAG: hypothetical protein H0T73_01480, partial [Ardenticatenales bacterium]|nr:hypothetical protein [Ardenticatenales bacterium]